jgi:shikimate kinase
MTGSKRHLYLIGFMGTGKSAIGTLVAERLGRPFHDLDEIVVKMRECTISEIFANEGEAAFRKYEIAALQTVITAPSAVIALGGGAPAVPAIAKQVSITGHVVLLTADWPSTWERVKGDASRPLLADVVHGHSDETTAFKRFLERAEAILQPRVAQYNALADCTVDTSALTIDAVAERVLTFVRRVER